MTSHSECPKPFGGDLDQNFYKTLLTVRARSERAVRSNLCVVCEEPPKLPEPDQGDSWRQVEHYRETGVCPPCAAIMDAEIGMVAAEQERG